MRLRTHSDRSPSLSPPGSALIDDTRGNVAFHTRCHGSPWPALIVRLVGFVRRPSHERGPHPRCGHRAFVIAPFVPRARRGLDAQSYEQRPRIRGDRPQVTGAERSQRPRLVGLTGRSAGQPPCGRMLDALCRSSDSDRGSLMEVSLLPLPQSPTLSLRSPTRDCPRTGGNRT